MKTILRFNLKKSNLTFVYEFWRVIVFPVNCRIYKPLVVLFSRIFLSFHLMSSSIRRKKMIIKMFEVELMFLMKNTLVLMYFTLIYDNINLL